MSTAPQIQKLEFPPPGWDLASDLVVLIGGGGQPAAWEFAAAGQRRILVFQPSILPVSGYPESAIVVTNTDAMHEAIRIHYTDDVPAKMFFRPVVLDRPPPEFGQIVAQVQEHLDSLQQIKKTRALHVATWARNSLANLPEMCRWATHNPLRKSFVGMPMIVVCAGPSVHTNIRLLERAKGKAVIATMSHALGAFRVAGAVAPDLVMVSDPAPCAYHLEGFDVTPTAGSSGYALGDLAWALSSVAPTHLWQMPGRKLPFCANPGADEQWIDEIMGEPCGLPGAGAVSTSLLTLGVYWGCSPIIYIGNDLALTDGLSYAEGVPDTQLEADTIPVPGYLGDVVETTQKYFHQARWLGGAAEMIQRSGKIRLINATEGGADIMNWQKITLRDAITRYCTVPVDVKGSLERTQDSHEERREPEARLARLSAKAKDMLAGNGWPRYWPDAVREESKPALRYIAQPASHGAEK